MTRPRRLLIEIEDLTAGLSEAALVAYAGKLVVFKDAGP